MQSLFLTPERSESVAVVAGVVVDVVEEGDEVVDAVDGVGSVPARGHGGEAAGVLDGVADGEGAGVDGAEQVLGRGEAGVELAHAGDLVLDVVDLVAQLLELVVQGEEGQGEGGQGGEGQEGAL